MASSASSRAPLLLRGMRSPHPLSLSPRAATLTTTTPPPISRRTPPSKAHQRHYAATDPPKPKSPAIHDPNKPILLEQPTKFIPPSHPSRRHGWSMPKIYGRKWTDNEKAESDARSYPGLMAPAGTWEHWFWHSRAVHMWITVGTLVSLAASTFIINFTTNSPFRHELPENELFWQNPIAFLALWRRAIRLHDEDRNQKLVEKYNRRADDAVKRRKYMRAHGMEADGVIGKLVGGNGEAAVGREEGVPVTRVGERMARSGGQ